MFAMISNLGMVCCCAGLDNLCHLSLSGHQCLSSQGLMILSNMTALTFLDLSGLLINKLLVVFDSCEVFGIFSKLDGSDLEPLNLCAMHFVLRLFAQPYTQSKKCFVEQCQSL